MSWAGTVLWGGAPSPALSRGRSAGDRGAARVAVHRLRQRYGELLRAEIAQTVATPEGIDEELRYLFSLLRE